MSKINKKNQIGKTDTVIPQNNLPNNSKIGLKELVLEADKLVAKPTISKMLKHTLQNIKEVDFRKEADLDDESKTLKRKHYLILVVECLLHEAKELELDFAYKNGSIYFYNRQYWEVVNEAEFNSFLGDAALKMGVDKFEAKFFKFKEELLKQFMADGNLKEVKPASNTILINLQNGTFEISDNGYYLREFQKEDFLIYQLPFSYQKKAEAPLFHKFLNDILPEQELQHILAEYLGSIFIKNEVLKLEKIAFLYGSGSNGKSVVFDIINALLGSRNFSSYSLESLTKDKDSRAMIADKLLNYASEMSTSMESDFFKKLASREPIDARPVYKSAFIMTNYARLMFNCNSLPNDIEYTHAFFRRFLIIPFRVTIKDEDQDKQLSQKIIRNELPGVFNWILQGMKRLLKNDGFTKSRIVENEVKRFQRESDSVLCFIDEEHYHVSTSAKISLKEMFIEYQAFCQGNGNRPVALRKFSERLKNDGFEMKRTNSGMVVFTEKKEDI